MSPSTSSTEQESEPGEPALLEVGRVARSHGVRGDVVVSLTTNRTERVDPGSVLRTAAGAALEVLTSRPHQGKWIVGFAGVSDRNAADALRGQVLMAPPLEDPDELWVHELVGSTVVDSNGVERGQITAVLENPAADLLELDDGRLVPIVFVVEQADGRVVVDVPEGLFDL